MVTMREGDGEVLQFTLIDKVGKNSCTTATGHRYTMGGRLHGGSGTLEPYKPEHELQLRCQDIAKKVGLVSTPFHPAHQYQTPEAIRRDLLKLLESKTQDRDKLNNQISRLEKNLLVLENQVAEWDAASSPASAP